jgi:short-subunit dehydrogenase involved in D-alanine esterification of teichoic acids
VRVFEVAPPIVPTELSGSRRRPGDDEHTLLPSQVAKGIIDALENDEYEVALGPAAELYRDREKLFSVINE